MVSNKTTKESQQVRQCVSDQWLHVTSETCSVTAYVAPNGTENNC